MVFREKPKQGPDSITYYITINILTNENLLNMWPVYFHIKSLKNDIITCAFLLIMIRFINSILIFIRVVVNYYNCTQNLRLAVNFEVFLSKMYTIEKK